MMTDAVDVDNLVKFVLDALNTHAYEDDCQIAVLQSAKRYAELGQRPCVKMAFQQLLHHHEQGEDEFAFTVR